MTTNHTPGPWCSFMGLTIQTDAGKVVATVQGPDFSKRAVEVEEAKANARLIAAAPELLAAVMAVGNIPANKDGTMTISIGSDAWHALRAAIAKAEGR